MPEEGLSFQEDRVYPDNREEVTVTFKRNPKEEKTSAKPP